MRWGDALLTHDSWSGVPRATKLLFHNNYGDSGSARMTTVVGMATVGGVATVGEVTSVGEWRALGSGECSGLAGARHKTGAEEALSIQVNWFAWHFTLLCRRAPIVASFLVKSTILRMFCTCTH